MRSHHEEPRSDAMGLGERLRELDAASPPPPLEAREIARLRAHVLGQVGAARSVRRPFPPLRTALRPLLVAATLAILLLLAMPLRRTTPPAGGAGGAGSREAREIQFTAPGGTQIVWVLDPSFTLER